VKPPKDPEFERTLPARLNGNGKGIGNRLMLQEKVEWAKQEISKGEDPREESQQWEINREQDGNGYFLRRHACGKGMDLRGDHFCFARGTLGKHRDYVWLEEKEVKGEGGC